MASDNRVKMKIHLSKLKSKIEKLKIIINMKLLGGIDYIKTIL